MSGLDLDQIALQVTGSTSSLIALFGPPIAELGGGGVVGFGVGYALKKILKILVILASIFIGLELAFLYWLQSIGAITITVNYNALSSIARSHAVAWGTMELGGLVAFASTISFLGTGFAAGVVLGFQKG